jgi:hypothetical protein
MFKKHTMSSATSALDNISSVNMLEMLITKDPRWSWIVGAWEQSEDESQRDLAKRVRAFRDDFLEKTAKLTLQTASPLGRAGAERMTFLSTTCAFGHRLHFQSRSTR